MSPKRKRTGKAERRAARRERLWATCDRLEVPVVVAVQVLTCPTLRAARRQGADVLAEADVEGHPEREQWQSQHRAELALRRSGQKGAVKKLRHRQARQIIEAFGVPQDRAFQLLNGTIEPETLLRISLELVEKRRREQWDAFYDRLWVRVNYDIWPSLDVGLYLHSLSPPLSLVLPMVVAVSRRHIAGGRPSRSPPLAAKSFRD